jgi:hypothetical protein
VFYKTITVVVDAPMSKLLTSVVVRLRNIKMSGHSKGSPYTKSILNGILYLLAFALVRLAFSQCNKI